MGLLRQKIRSIRMMKNDGKLVIVTRNADKINLTFVVYSHIIGGVVMIQARCQQRRHLLNIFMEVPR